MECIQFLAQPPREKTQEAVSPRSNHDDTVIGVRCSHHHSLLLLNPKLHGSLHYLEDKVGSPLLLSSRPYCWDYSISRKLHTHINVLVSILLSLQIIIAPLVGKHAHYLQIVRLEGSFKLNYPVAGLSTPGYLLLFHNETINTVSSIIWRVAFIFNCFTEVSSFKVFRYPKPYLYVPLELNHDHGECCQVVQDLYQSKLKT